MDDFALIPRKMLVAEPAAGGKDVGGVEVQTGMVGGVLVELDAVLQISRKLLV